MRIKKNISLEDSILEKGLDKAKALGMNFSTYLTYLINKDCGEIAITEIKKEKGNKLPKETVNTIDSIIGD